MAAIAAPPKRKQPALAQACVLCRIAHTACTGTRPCRRCVTEGTPDKCHFTVPKKRGRPPRLDKKPKTTDDKASVSEPPSSTPRSAAAPRASPPLLPEQANMGSSLGPPSSTPPVAISPYPVPSSFISLFVHNASPSVPAPTPQGSASSFLPPLAPAPPQPSNVPQPQLHTTPTPQSFVPSAVPSSSSTTTTPSVSPSAASPVPSPPAMDSLLSLLVQEIKELKKTVKTVRQDMETLRKRQDDVERTVGLLSAQVAASSFPASQSTHTSSSFPFSSLSSVPGGDLMRLRATNSFNLGDSHAYSPYEHSSTLHESLVIARQNILQHFPFLADYDLASPSIPFVVDDIRKPCWAYRVTPRQLGEDMKPPIIVYANTAYCRLTGYASHELLGMSSQKIAYLEDEHKKKLVHLIFQQTALPYTDVFNISYKCLRKDQRTLRLHARYQIFYNASGKWQWVMACVERIEQLPLSPEEEAKITSWAVTPSTTPRPQGHCLNCGITIFDAGDGPPTSSRVCPACMAARRRQPLPPRSDSGLHHNQHHDAHFSSNSNGLHTPLSSGGGALGAIPPSPPPPQSPDYGGYWGM